MQHIHHQYAAQKLLFLHLFSCGCCFLCFAAGEEDVPGGEEDAWLCWGCSQITRTPFLHSMQPVRVLGACACPHTFPSQQHAFRASYNTLWDQ